MDNNLQAALKYLSAPAGSFWKWVDDGNAVGWVHGGTLAFREELASVLQRMADRGLPSLDGILLLIAATRSNWNDDSAALRMKLQHPTHFRVEQVIKLLDQVHQLPSELIHPLEAKVMLADMVFESVRPAVTGDVARIACEVLSHGMVREHRMIPNLQLLRGGSVQTSASLSRELLPMYPGLADITAESLRLRSTTGLDEPPMPADVVLPIEPMAVRTLLQRLSQDEELGGLTRVARNLSAVLQLPRAISDPDELPLGGVSDISHRGTLDRLLLSELAHDDLMLATRVALNEALYLRRETPPGQPPQRRYVLLDSGLRMWGVPRVYAAAVMLSLAATSEGASLLAWRASGGDVVPIDLSTREGLVRHLQALEPEVHPGLALKPFFETAAGAQTGSRDAGDRAGEAILITSDDGLADPEFQHALADAPPCYVATVNRDGDFRLWARGVRGAKCLFSLKLDLDELLVPSRVKLVDPGLDPNLPAIFRVAPLPFRLPYQQSHSTSREVYWSVWLPDDVRSETKAACGVMILTRDRSLILFDTPGRGAAQIADGVPFGTLVWSSGSSDHHLSYALIHRPSDPSLHLFVVNLVLRRLVAARMLASQHLTHSTQILGATEHSGILYVIYRTSVVEAFDLVEGRLLYQLAVPDRMNWRGGRFFTDATAPACDEWHALTCDGTGLRFEQVRLRGPERAGQLLRLFDRRGHDGPFGVHLRGSIANLSNQTEWEWTTNPRSSPVVLEISDRGDRLLIEQDPDPSSSPLPAGVHKIHRMITLDVPAAFDVPVFISSLAQWDLRSHTLGGSLLHRIVSACVIDGRLTLTTRTQTNRLLVAHNKKLLLQQVSGKQPFLAGVTFQQARHPNPGCTLTVATWEDGSRALVDSRGLLHLQSSDPAIAEATLVLNDRDVAAWTSDGRVCGSPYFVDASSGLPMTADEFVTQVLDPFVARLCSNAFANH